jgi:hypothetical protein
MRKRELATGGWVCLTKRVWWLSGLQQFEREGGPLNRPINDLAREKDASRADLPARLNLSHSQSQSLSAEFIHLQKHLYPVGHGPRDVPPRRTSSRVPVISHLGT